MNNRSDLKHLLLIDTTGSTLMLGYASFSYKNGKCIQYHLKIDKRFNDNDYIHKNLVIHVDKLLNEYQLKKQLTHIGYGIGPGRLMGCDLGLAFAQGIAAGLGITPKPFSTANAIKFTALRDYNIHENKIAIIRSLNKTTSYLITYDNMHMPHVSCIKDQMHDYYLIQDVDDEPHVICDLKVPTCLTTIATNWILSYV